jgi:acyl-CoA synthetase (NDP forming)
MADPRTTVACGRGYRDAVGKLFAPESVAVVGASPSGPGLAAVENLLAGRYRGRLGCVNPRHRLVAGIRCVPEIGQLDFRPEAVVLATGPERVPSLLGQAAEVGARAAVVFALGMGATGESGDQLQAGIVAVARDAEMAVLGPNCQGAINFAGGVALYMSPVREHPPGRVALISQSGSVLTGLLNNRRGVRWSHAVSTGNEAVTDAADVLEAYVDDPAVRVICAYLETIRRPEAFFAQCDRAYASGKPVIVHKAGRTARGQAAAIAHTGALALPERLLAAALRHHRVSVVASVEELLETAKAMQATSRPRGGAMAAITGSGGHIELLEDEIGDVDLTLPPFSVDTRARMCQLLAPFLEPSNPLDWWGTPDHETRVPAIVETAAGDAGIDILVEVDDYASGFVSNRDRGSQSLRRAVEAGPTGGALRALIDPVSGGPAAADIEVALASGVPLLSGMRDGLRALSHLVEYARPTSPARASEVLGGGEVEARWASLTHGVNAGSRVLELIEAAGIDVPRSRRARTSREAVEAADALGYPVVAKTEDESVAHKTDRGGVVVGLRTATDVAAAATRLLAQHGAILVQEQIVGGIELIVGRQRHPLLGSFMMTGLGGVWTEVLDDVAIRCVGLREREARTMLDGLRGSSLLHAIRGGEQPDLEAASAAIERVDDLGTTLGSELAELELNPLIVTGTRAVAVDALVVKGEIGAARPQSVGALEVSA